MFTKDFIKECASLLIEYHSHCSKKNLYPYSLEEIDAIIYRNLFTVKETINDLNNKPKEIVNLSGFSNGHPAIVLGLAYHYLDIKFRSYDTKSNKFFEVVTNFKGLKDKVDFNEFEVQETSKYHFLDNSVVLFTEIVEHLDLSYIYSFLSNLPRTNYLLYITTPNIAYWKNILKILYGNKKYEVFTGYGRKEFLEKNYGHIHLFDKKFITTVFEDSGFNCKSKYFNWPINNKQLLKDCSSNRVLGENISIHARPIEINV